MEVELLEWKDLFSWRMFSIAVSFASFANSYCVIMLVVLKWIPACNIIFTYFRNREKKLALTIRHFALLLLKIIFDCISRITLFSAFMYVTNKGQFSTMYVVIGYYVMWLIMVIFNVVFNKDRSLSSGRDWIGKK